MYNKTLIERLTDVKDGAVDLCMLRCWEIVSSILFLYAFAGGRKRWLNCLYTFAFVEAVYVLICPKKYLGYFLDGTPDETHLQLAQLANLALLAWVLCYWLLNKSTDSTTETSILLANTVYICCAFLAIVYALTHQTTKKSGLKFGDDMKVPTVYMSLLLVVGYLYFYLSAKDWGGYGEIMSHANHHLRADFVVLMMMGLMMYALPQWMIRLMTNVEKVDAIHAVFCRTCGALLMAMSFMSGRATNFLRAGDKDAVVFSHFMFYVLLMAMNVWAVVTGWADFQWRESAPKFVHDGLLVLNAAAALNFDTGVFQKILIPRLQATIKDCCSSCCWGKWKSA